MSTTAMFILVWLGLLGNLALTLRLAVRLKPVLNPFEHMPADFALAQGQPAPPFTAQTLEGEVVTLDDYADRTLTLVFISHSCSGCRALLPKLGSLWRLAIDAGSELVLVVFEADSATLTETRTVIDEFEIPARTLLVPVSHPLREAYNPRQATPFYCHVEKGAVSTTGAVGGDGWKQLMRRWQASAVTPATRS